MLSEQFNPVCLDMLFHVEPLDEPPVTVGTLVWLLPSVDLPVSVETAGVGQQLTALLALHCSLPIGADYVGPADSKMLAILSVLGTGGGHLLDSTGGVFLSLDFIKEGVVGVQPVVALGWQVGQEVSSQPLGDVPHPHCLG